MRESSMSSTFLNSLTVLVFMCPHLQEGHPSKLLQRLWRIYERPTDARGIASKLTSPCEDIYSKNRMRPSRRLIPASLYICARNSATCCYRSFSNHKSQTKKDSSISIKLYRESIPRSSAAIRM